MGTARYNIVDLAPFQAGYCELSIVAIVWYAFMWFFVLYVNLSADKYEIHVTKLLLERAAGVQGAWSIYVGIHAYV
jgi:hypothetical protein